MPLKSERRRSLVAKRFSISSSDAKCTPGGRTPKGAPSLYMNVGIMTQHYRWVKDRVNYICPIVGLYATACSNRNKILAFRSEEHTSELQSLMRISYAVFCLKK